VRHSQTLNPPIVGDAPPADLADHKLALSRRNPLFEPVRHIVPDASDLQVLQRRSLRDIEATPVEDLDDRRSAAPVSPMADNAKDHVPAGPQAKRDQLAGLPIARVLEAFANAAGVPLRGIE
jgi:hypothetical protein